MGNVLKHGWKVLAAVFLLGGAASLANFLGFTDLGKMLEEQKPVAEVSTTVVQ